MTLSRRQFLYGSACAGTALFLSTFIDGKRVVLAVPIPGGTPGRDHPVSNYDARRCRQISPS